MKFFKHISIHRWFFQFCFQFFKRPKKKKEEENINRKKHWKCDRNRNQLICLSEFSCLMTRTIKIKQPCLSDPCDRVASCLCCRNSFFFFVCEKENLNLKWIVENFIYKLSPVNSISDSFFFAFTISLSPPLRNVRHAAWRGKGKIK